jgi:5'-nucleotidase/UDP-sugar diphosphatase
VKIAISVLGLALFLGMGCQDDKAAQPSSMDVSSPTVAPASATLTPAPVATPVVADASQTPAMSDSTTTGGNTYTIKQGDTLWKIATAHYGDGKKWKAIVDANPGLEPSKLRVGQTITLP